MQMVLASGNPIKIRNTSSKKTVHLLHSKNSGLMSISIDGAIIPWNSARGKKFLVGNGDNYKTTFFRRILFEV